MNDERVLSEAEKGEEGRRSAYSLSGAAKDLSNESAELGSQLAKLAANDTVSCAAFAYDEADEVLVYRCINDARQAVGQARERVTAALVAAMNAAGRV